MITKNVYDIKVSNLNNGALLDIKYNNVPFMEEQKDDVDFKEYAMELISKIKSSLIYGEEITFNKRSIINDVNSSCLTSEIDCEAFFISIMIKGNNKNIEDIYNALVCEEKSYTNTNSRQLKIDNNLAESEFLIQNGTDQQIISYFLKFIKRNNYLYVLPFENFVGYYETYKYIKESNAASYKQLKDIITILLSMEVSDYYLNEAHIQEYNKIYGSLRKDLEELENSKSKKRVKIVD